MIGARRDFADRQALASTLARFSDFHLTTDEFERLGIEDYRRMPLFPAGA